MYLLGPSKNITEEARTPIALPAGATRRMSRIMRMACDSAIDAMNSCAINSIDGIYFGTGLGCLDDTGKFLTEIHTIHGSPLSPTPFIRSTHNTMAGQLALFLGARGPNITVSQGFFSFHLALLQGLLHVEAEPKHRVLIAAADERTPLLEKLVGQLAQEIPYTENALLGEGAATFLMSGERSESACARIAGIWIGRIADDAPWNQRMAAIDVDPSAIDQVFVSRDILTRNMPWHPPKAKVVDYRSSTGIHFSAPAHAMALALDALTSNTAIRYVLIADRDGDREALILLERC